MARNRRRRPEPVPWERDWRNPEMKVLRSYIDQETGEKVTEEMTPDQSADLSSEGMSVGYPKYREDPSYRWARAVRRKREREGPP